MSYDNHQLMCDLIYFHFLFQGKGCYWALHTKCATMFENGSLLRRRKRFKLEGMEGNIKTASNPTTSQPGQIRNLPQPVTSDLSRMQSDIQCHTPVQIKSETQHRASPLRNSSLHMATLPSAQISSTNMLLNNLSPSTSLTAAYSQMLMQYYAMMPSLWSTSMFNPLTAATPASPSLYNIDPRMMADYINLLKKQSGFYESVKPEPSSDCESYGGRYSPVSTGVSSPSSEPDCYIINQEQALDLTSKH